MAKKNTEKFYVIEKYPSIEKGKAELFTLRDANEMLKHYQNKHPEICLKVREFE